MGTANANAIALIMGHKVKKTEHSGSKKGRGAFYGRKAVAKKSSNKQRRSNDRRQEKLRSKE